MARDDTVFEREQLYAEVWKGPVRIVAKRYGISDVGLRKICRKLGVPMPPLGYWAKLEAGKKPRIVPLQRDYAGQTRLLRSSVQVTGASRSLVVRSIRRGYQRSAIAVAREDAHAAATDRQLPTRSAASRA